jgi:hypothetical protein
MKKHFSKENLFDELKLRPGLIPVSIDAENGRLNWLDAEKYHFYEGFFNQSLRMFSALKKGNLFEFTTDLTVLEDNRILTDYVRPSGFIFHAGRSGSTLLAKILARTRRNLVISEAAPQNQIWEFLAADGEKFPEKSERNKRIYKNLLLAMARKRVAAHEKHFIKFTSFNIRFFDFIKSVFPDVPSVFLYREPKRILASLNKKPAAWSDLKNQESVKFLLGVSPEKATTGFAAQAIESFFTVALRHGSGKLKYLNFDKLNRENLPIVFKFFNVEAEESELKLMQSEFNFYSKSDFNKKKFSGSPDLESTDEASAALEIIFRRLKSSRHNLLT